MPWRLLVRALVVGCGIFPNLAFADNQTIEEPTVFDFQPVGRGTDSAIAQFADKFIHDLVRNDRPLMPAWWHKKGDKTKLIDFVQYLEADIGDETPALFLQVELGPYCGTAGCQTYVFDHKENGFVLLCSDNMYDRSITVLPEKEERMHLVDTGAAVIHWSDHADSTGQHCSPVAKAATTQQNANEGFNVKYRQIDDRTDPEIVRLAEEVLKRDEVLILPWAKKPTDVISYLEVDLSGKAGRELFLRINTGCGTVGCVTYIYRRTPTEYEKICEEDSDDDTIRILPKKDNGFYLVDTGKRFIHWMRTPDSAGDLCR